MYACYEGKRWVKKDKERIFQAERNGPRPGSARIPRPLSEMKKVVWVGKEIGSSSYKSQLARL